MQNRTFIGRLLEMQVLLVIAATLWCCGLVTGGLAVCDPGPCGPGLFWNTTTGCQKCQDGGYMTNSNHKCLSCIPCTENRPDLVKLKNCTATENTKYQCPAGSVKYSNDDSDGPECKLCRECSEGYRKVKNCTGDNDTICEPQPQVSGKTGDTNHQSTEASVGNESQTNHGQYRTDTSTQPNDNQTWSTNVINYNSTSSNITTEDISNANIIIIVSTVVPALAVLVFALVILVWVRHRYKSKKQKQTTSTNNDESRGRMLETRT